jgi:hypothetical protein
MIYLCYLYLFTFTGVQHDLYIRCCSCRLTVTRRVSHVEQELLTLPEPLSSHPVFGGVRVARFLVFCVMFCRSLFVFFVWPLSCLSVFDLRILITPLVSSIFSYHTFRSTNAHAITLIKRRYLIWCADAFLE